MIYDCVATARDIFVDRAGINMVAILYPSMVRSSARIIREAMLIDTSHGYVLVGLSSDTWSS